ncbi:hypothetical protein Tco_1301781 [Tanacetum coccineum]
MANLSEDNVAPVVQNNASMVPNDAYVMIDNDVHKYDVLSVSHTPRNTVANNLLNAELATYKEQVELYERRARFELTEREQKIDEQLRIVICDRNIMEENLKKELRSVKLQLASNHRNKTNTLREIVEEAKVERPLDRSLAFACRYTKHSQELLEYVFGTCPKVVQIVLWYLDSGCSKHMTGDRSRLMNFVKKFIGTVRFGNDHFGAIMGYGDYVVGNSVISRVYYVEGLGHNLFSVGQFCDSDLEVAFRKHSCYVRDTDGVELLKGSCGSNLYTISVEDMMKSSPICLLFGGAFRRHSWSVRDTDGLKLLKGSRVLMYTLSVERHDDVLPNLFVIKALEHNHGYAFEFLTSYTFGTINDACKKDLV